MQREPRIRVPSRKTKTNEDLDFIIHEDPAEDTNIPTANPRPRETTSTPILPLNSLFKKQQQIMLLKQQK
jgi:hypothetical protein